MVLHQNVPTVTFEWKYVEEKQVTYLIYFNKYYKHAEAISTQYDRIVKFRVSYFATTLYTKQSSPSPNIKTLVKHKKLHGAKIFTMGDT